MAFDVSKVASSPELMSVEDANATLTNSVVLPVFFEKLSADYGLVPESDDEALLYVKMAADLRTAATQQVQKTASTRTSRLQRMHSELHQVVHGKVATQPSLDAQVKQAAAMVAKNPAVASAALSLYAARQSQQA